MGFNCLNNAVVNVLINLVIFGPDLFPLDACKCYFRVKEFVHFTCNSSHLVWCSDALRFSNSLFLVQILRNQFLLSCVFQIMLNMTALFSFFNAKMMSFLQIHLWQIFPRANFLIFIARIWSCLHVSSLPFLLLWFPSAWWCFKNLLLCVYNGTESASAQSAEIKCWTDLATCLVGDSYLKFIVSVSTLGHLGSLTEQSCIWKQNLVDDWVLQECICVSPHPPLEVLSSSGQQCLGLFM